MSTRGNFEGRWALPPLAVTMGEPTGIGIEITLKAWLRRASNDPPFFVVGDPERLDTLARKLGLDVPIRTISVAEEATATFETALPVLVEALDVPAVYGRLDPANSGCVRRCIEKAVDLTVKGQASAVITNPIHKHVMHQAGFTFPGHTEFLGHLGGRRERPVMMLASPGLRVVPVTIHLGLLDAINSLTTSLIIETCQVLEPALRVDFSLKNPRLSVSGLNPHAGEGGTFGDEENRIIEPAISALRQGGMSVSGPHAADTMFSERNRKHFDAAVCMYHDQALIPIKALDFDRTVNVTLGLPFVRTSPDHGTACDIAGTGKASEESLVSALGMAAEMALARAIPRAVHNS
jgi:4-hydroxythreonine-4-phosphate dehydrogenase